MNQSITGIFVGHTLHACPTEIALGIIPKTLFLFSTPGPMDKDGPICYDISMILTLSAILILNRKL